MIVSIHQPHFLAWLGYFNKVARSDKFVWLNTVQYRDRYYQNRCKIRNGEGWLWLTIPVFSERESIIKDIAIAEPEWKARIAKTLQRTYGRAPFFKETWPTFADALERSDSTLDDADFQSFMALLRILDLPISVERADALPKVSEDPTGRLVETCRIVGGTKYLAGRGGRNYMDLDQFANAGIEVIWQDFDFNLVEYPQTQRPFVPGLSLVDCLFNAGPAETRRLVLESWRPLTAEPAMYLLLYRSDSLSGTAGWTRAKFADLDSALRAIEQSDAHEAVLCRPDLARHAIKQLDGRQADYDLLHAGLLFEGGDAFVTLHATSTTWFLLNPDGGRACTSWKATADLCWLRPNSVRALGGFDPAYRSPEARLMDLGFRILMRGGRVRHDPRLAPQARGRAVFLGIPLVDEFVFTFRHIGARAAAYSALCHTLIYRYRRHYAIRDFREARRRVRAHAAPAARPDADAAFRLMAATPRQKVGTMTAIIPTINRYDYMPGSIRSLQQSEPPPDEILVVDQTPVESRRPEVYAPFEEDGPDRFRVIYLDKAGQSSARNRAIAEARGEWLMLFEDDAEAWEDMIAQHVRAVELSGAAASTGISLAPWKTREHIPERLRRFMLAEVLATGNCLIRKDAVLDVGGLDHAFDRGSGADHDLGARLYLRGYEIIFNPLAIETHYKAPSGGMRTYGAWWRNQVTVWAPYPPPTQVYTIQRYKPRAYWPALYFYYFLQAVPRGGAAGRVWLWLSSPWKIWKALRAARKLKTHFGLAATESDDPTPAPTASPFAPGSGTPESENCG